VENFGIKKSYDFISTSRYIEVNRKGVGRECRRERERKRISREISSLL
jgi:hypothetical protein